MDRGLAMPTFEIAFSFPAEDGRESGGSISAFHSWLNERMKELKKAGYLIQGSGAEGILIKLWPRPTNRWTGYVIFTVKPLEQAAMEEREMKRSAKAAVESIMERHKPQPDAEGEVIES